MCEKSFHDHWFTTTRKEDETYDVYGVCTLAHTAYYCKTILDYANTHTTAAGEVYYLVTRHVWKYTDKILTSIKLNSLCTIKIVSLVRYGAMTAPLHQCTLHTAQATRFMQWHLFVCEMSLMLNDGTFASFAPCAVPHDECNIVSVCNGR